MCHKEFLCLVLLLWAASPSLYAKQSPYVGVERCTRCHNDPPFGPVPIWSKGPHAKAFNRLLSPAAKKIAAQQGIKAPEKAMACLVCHSTAPGLKKRSTGRGLRLSEGISCEACHGPGKKYAKFAVMTKIAMLRLRKPKKAAIEAKKFGLLFQGSKSCARCHSPKVVFRGVTYVNPTYRPLAIEASLVKIRHWQ